MSTMLLNTIKEVKRTVEVVYDILETLVLTNLCYDLLDRDYHRVL